MKINKQNILWLLKTQGYCVETEYQFARPRKFRADYKITRENSDKTVLVEYEGIMSSKSRHTGVQGYSNDCSKYNLAQIKGYIVLRYTVLNIDEILDDLKSIFS